MPGAAPQSSCRGVHPVGVPVGLLVDGVRPVAVRHKDLKRRELGGIITRSTARTRPPRKGGFTGWRLPLQGDDLPELEDAVWQQELRVGM